MQTAVVGSNSLSATRSLPATVPGKVVLGLAATLAIAAAAHVAIPLPFTPVPLSLQPLAVLGVGLALGPVAGFLTLLAYLAEGLLGLPVFTPTGPGGALQLFGLTGGYLLAYPIVAAVAGGVTRALEGKLPRFAAAGIACTLAVIVLFTSGASWMMHLTHASLAQIWLQAVSPFLPGEAIKIVIAAGVYGTLTRSHKISPSL